MVRTPHLDQAYERELSNLTNELSAMADLAESMVRDAVHALVSRDVELANRVMETDARLDQYELDLDRRCVEVLARRSPVAGDLRLVTATLKLVTDIERIGDLAVNVSKRVGMVAGTLGGVPAEVGALARSASDELALAFKALRNRDVKLAHCLRDADKTTDARNRDAFERLLMLSRERNDGFEDLLALTNICRHLERIGDHAVNVSEMVVFMVEGKMIRHHTDDPTTD